MKKTYLLVFDNTMGSQKSIKQWADSSPLVNTWRYDLPHCFYLVSEVSAGELSEDFRNYFGTRGRFLITEVSENRQGRLPANTWYFLRFKQVRSRKRSV